MLQIRDDKHLLISEKEQERELNPLQIGIWHGQVFQDPIIHLVEELRAPESFHRA